ncbi:MAG: hypothetical protein QME63_02090 [Actinomycetota bacterium]|nr:hypothetical protein [Actinomycetota bacterium]
MNLERTLSFFKILVNKDTGFFSYVKRDRLYNLDVARNMPSDEEAKTRALNFLKGKGLLPERFDTIKVRSAITGDPLQGDLRTIAKDVWIYPTVNSRPVYGVSRIIVTIGDALH